MCGCRDESTLTTIVAGIEAARGMFNRCGVSFRIRERWEGRLESLEEDAREAMRQAQDWEERENQSQEA